jgi:site-specific recombinase XerD
MTTQHQEGTLQHAIDQFLQTKRKRAPETLTWYRQQLAAWLAWLEAKQVKQLAWLEPKQLDAFLDAEKARGLADSTVHARFRALRALFRWLDRQGKLPGFKPPTAVIEPPSDKTAEPRQADPAAVQRVLNAIPHDTWLDHRDRMLIELLRSTGLRVEEAVCLHIQDIDLGDGFVFVEAGKGNKGRIAPFHDAFRLAFVAYMFNRPPWSGPELLLAASGHRRPTGQLQTNGVRQLLRRRCAAASETYINPHSLRHMFAIKALNDGVSLSAVSAILGHTSLAFTARVYAKWIKRGLRREYDTHWQQ